MLLEGHGVQCDAHAGSFVRHHYLVHPLLQALCFRPDVAPARSDAKGHRRAFDDLGWDFEDKCDGFRMIAEILRGKFALLQPQRQDHQSQLYRGRQSSRGVKGDAVIDGELSAIGKDGISHFRLLQNALLRKRFRQFK